MVNKIIGITGIIGSGKSTVAGIISAKGYRVLDADKIAGNIMEENLSLREDIILEFGKKSYKEDGSLNRPYIAGIVFSDLKALEKLNALVHPRVKEVFLEKSEKEGFKDHLIFWDVPLLFEGELWKFCRKIILVKADKKIRLERNAKSGKFNPEDFEKREAEQIPLIEKEKKSDYIIDNSASLNATKEQVVIVLKKILKENTG